MTKNWLSNKIFQKVIFQGTGAIDLSEDYSSEDDCGIHAYLGEPTCECGALDKLATTVETFETCLKLR